MRITVIICTYNRSFILKECLKSLITQSNKDFDIIVIDNNSTDSTLIMINNQFPNIDVFVEKKQGLSHARNRGVEECGNEWLAYLDDDAVAHSDWVQEIYNTIEITDFVAFGGIYLPWYRDGKPSWYLDSYGSNKDFFRKLDGMRELSGSECFSGGNAVYRKKELVAIGCFPIELGMKGDKIGYGEEDFVQKELVKKGGKIGINPNLLIDHYVPKYKQNLKWFLKRSFVAGKESVKIHNDKKSFLLLLKKSTLLIFYFFVAVLISFFNVVRGKYKWQNFLIRSLSKPLTIYGSIVGLLEKNDNKKTMI